MGQAQRRGVFIADGRMRPMRLTVNDFVNGHIARNA